METIDRKKGALKLDIDTYVVINGPSDGKLPSWVGCYVHPSAGSSIKVRINSKPNSLNLSLFVAAQNRAK
jgi:hypothetical protein